MKWSIALGLAVLLFQPAFANDTSIARITVKDIQLRQEKLDKTVINFEGKEAANLMQILPSVLSSSNNKDIESNQKFLKIVGLNGRHVGIGCSGGEFQLDPISGHVQFVLYPDGPKCEIVIDVHKYNQKSNEYQITHAFVPDLQCH